MRVFRILVLIVIACLSPIMAQIDSTLSIYRFQKAPAFDGIPEDLEWHNATSLPLVSSYPNENGIPSEKTEIRIGYTEEFIFVGGSFFNQNISDLQANSLTRDKAASSDDMFGFILDTFNDNENALAFLTTPTGIRLDQTIFNDAEVISDVLPFNESWNTFWDVKTEITKEGWFMEMRIPFSSLRFQDIKGKVSMGLLAWRWLGKKTEAINFPPFPKKFMLAHLKPSIMATITFEGLQRKNPVYLTPYFLAGFGYNHELNDPETAYLKDDSFKRELGLDLKYSLTSNLTLDLTANMDFAQVEADDEQVNLTRFSLFFPEKRLFFQERSSVFEFATGDGTRLFYSRRIGIDEDGNIIPIYGGARLVGRIGTWDVGAMNLQTEKSYELESENFNVLRWRRRLFNPFSSVGGIFTSRINARGDNNFALGLDSNIRLWGDDYLAFALAQSVLRGDEAPESDAFSKNGRLSLQVNRRSFQGMGYKLGTIWSGEYFDPGAGFIFRENFTKWNGDLGYTWLYSDKSKFNSTQIEWLNSVYLRNVDSEVESAIIGPRIQTSFKNTGGAILWLRSNYEALQEAFELSDDINIVPGAYNFTDVDMLFFTPFSMPYRAEGEITVGQYYDGTRFSVAINPEWSLSKYLTLLGRIQYNRIEFDKTKQVFRGDVYQIRARFAFNTQLSGNVFAQYNTFDEDVTVNVRFRYNFREGNDFYVVYNEGVNMDRFRFNPVKPRNLNRTLMAKFSYTSTWM
ncbi:MAG: carbohydrate binding family 9 domain-containing protein [Deferribacteres bacterium]|nr:carbohydrate binding family 9 domain-containing protein [candidate division KSB1 bacterium]MCB9504352.1 carbohydrate binding family 9 domain-containing protein [Deferribacteres bacterium]